ncbi:thiamine pyrophosphate-dependent enzyme [Thetidibacter halocola]|uniref:Thiamine pyrophosphate-binding protein n=1 Tax=Thetidibacter halocola TaxID=2827239 RepID=A0A8J7WDV3_9RHOB|nr:thiamine pyrophosphate-dependent enzyme [Thetidibacter halocola]MBS0123891.1 thiamine pyrophosphate-binding protein [Thetidibacter halocola]
MAAPDAIAATCAAAGIARVYTVPGDLTYPLLRALAAAGLTVISCRTQTGAVFAAEADSFAVGRLESVVLVSRGPALALALAAFHSAIRNGAPMLLLSLVETNEDTARGAFQGAETALVPASCRRLRLAVAGSLVDDLGAALANAVGPSRVPAIVELERPLLGAMLLGAATAPAPLPPVAPASAEEDWAAPAAAALAAAERPVVVVGHEARWSVDITDIARLARRLGAPLCPTGLSIGFGGAEVPQVPHDRVHATLASADAVVLLGAQFDWSLRFGAAIPASATVVALTPTSGPPAAARSPDHACLGPIGASLDLLLRHLPTNRPDRADPAPRRDDLARPAPALLDQVLGSLAGRLAPSTALVLDGSSQLIHAGRNLIPAGAWSRITPGVYGHLGAGLGHAIGALASRRFTSAVVIAGDFSLGLGLADLETLVRYRFPVCVVVANNFGMGSESGQLGGTDTRIAGYARTTDHAAIMRGFGGTGHRVCHFAEWEAIAPQALAADHPCLVDVVTGGRDT